MPHAIVINKTGGPEVMKYVEVPMPRPKAGEIRIRQTAIGLNFIDTYFRTGLYPADLPLTLGAEGAGVVDAIGRGVKGFKEGDRVACVHPGAYTEVR
ncbi:MAG: alcohol dehydrogenase catalytic domain-containing protein, partial [Alphaproteobacteria bacterium]|nr:alcohol dehydrogenase catalytic domain-containing protein [Alphaproteobacteria bacterium]